MPRIHRSAIAEAFGKTLREVPRECGISQERLADIGGFDRTYPSLLERGLRQPTLTVLMDLADALGVSAERLVIDTQARLTGAAPAGKTPPPPIGEARPHCVPQAALPASDVNSQPAPATDPPSGGHRA
ncbi:MAG TPA: helix-turn-helix transcriptional regulator [Steroidobacteraceae bacterium]|jgi:transcriptional regulator with XRE-family HTH domain